MINEVLVILVWYHDSPYCIAELLKLWFGLTLCNCVLSLTLVLRVCCSLQALVSTTPAFSCLRKAALIWEQLFIPW